MSQKGLSWRRVSPLRVILANRSKPQRPHMSNGDHDCTDWPYVLVKTKQDYAVNALTAVSERLQGFSICYLLFLLGIDLKFTVPQIFIATLSTGCLESFHVFLPKKQKVWGCFLLLLHPLQLPEQDIACNRHCVVHAFNGWHICDWNWEDIYAKWMSWKNQLSQSEEI